MLCSKWLTSMLVMGISTASCATQPHHYECPSVLVDGQSKHAFSHVEAYDTPPQNMGSLIPVATKYGDQWDVTKDADIYLVCGYKGTDKTTTVHAPGVTICKAPNATGTTAFCE
jgi:hypothetical protein